MLLTIMALNDLFCAVKKLTYTPGLEVLEDKKINKILGLCLDKKSLENFKTFC